jgi:hypothetical protein
MLGVLAVLETCPYRALGSGRGLALRLRLRLDTGIAANEEKMSQHLPIEIGYQVYLKDGAAEVGAVRDVSAHRKDLLIYIENSGDFAVPFEAISSVHFQKVILNPAKLSPELLKAIRKAHDAEDPEP